MTTEFLVCSACYQALSPSTVQEKRAFELIRTSTEHVTKWKCPMCDDVVYFLLHVDAE